MSFILFADKLQNFDNKRDIKKQSLYDTILVLKQVYGKIWDISNCINDSFGWSLLAIVSFLLSFFYMFIDPYLYLTLLFTHTPLLFHSLTHSVHFDVVSIWHIYKRHEHIYTIIYIVYLFSCFLFFFHCC